MRKFGVFCHFWSEWPLTLPPLGQGCVLGLVSLQCPCSVPRCVPPVSLQAEDRVSLQLLPTTGAYPNPTLEGKRWVGLGLVCGCLVGLKSGS